MNHKRVERIWRREGLKVPQKQPKRARLWLNDGSCVRLKPEHKDHVWSYDLMMARTAEGRAFRILTVIDEYTRECLKLPATCSRGHRPVDSNLTSGTINGGRSPEKNLLKVDLFTMNEVISIVGFNRIEIYGKRNKEILSQPENPLSENDDFLWSWGYIAQGKHFIESLMQDKSPDPGLDSGIKAAQVINSAKKSIREHKTVQFESL